MSQPVVPGIMGQEMPCGAVVRVKTNDMNSLPEQAYFQGKVERHYATCPDCIKARETTPPSWELSRVRYT